MNKMGKIMVLVLLFMALPVEAGFRAPADMADQVRAIPSTSKNENAVAAQPQQASSEESLAGLSEQLQTESAKPEVSLSSLKDAQQAVRATQIIEKTGGIAPDKALKLNRAGIPIFSTIEKKMVKNKKGKDRWVKVAKKVIPRLNIGREPEVQAQDFTLPSVQFGLKAPQKLKALPSQRLISKKEVEKTLKAKRIFAKKPLSPKNLLKDAGKPVTAETVAKIGYEVQPESPFDVKEFRNFSKSEIQMLAVSVLNKGGDQCHLVTGILQRLKKTKSLSLEAQARLGFCAAKLKLFTPAYTLLSRLIRSENPDYASKAIRALAKNLPEEYEKNFAKIIRKLKSPSLIPNDIEDRVAYLTAKGSLKSDYSKSAEKWARKVGSDSDWSNDAQMILASAEHLNGKSSAAIRRLEALKKKLNLVGEADKSLESLVVINLARIYFSKGQPEKALSNYAKVDKSHSLWVQSLIERGWVQLATDDFSGAIGSMYSLHSPYFRSVYKPESFVIRSIGYLNICQYADAYKTLSWLEKQYQPWVKVLESYKGKKNPALAYETVKKYLRGKSVQGVDGLPPSALREMARQRSFLNAQKALNGKEDEILRYGRVLKEMNQAKANIRRRVQKAQSRLAESKAQLKLSKTDAKLANQASQFRSSIRVEGLVIAALTFEAELLELSRRGYEEFRGQSKIKIAKAKKNLRKKAGQSIIRTHKKMIADINRVIDNNEFLRYEVFAGSGENIRFQVSGGKTQNSHRVPASIKPKKMMNWNFDGEFWEDEIGSYRSTLKNNCPKSGRMNSFKLKPEGVQAAHLKGDK